MAKEYVSIRNIKFLLHEVLEVEKLNRFSFYQDYDKDAFNMAIDAAKQIGDTYLFPFYQDMDKNKAVFKDGVVKAHPSLKAAIKAIGDGGWISAHDDFDHGGQQMPFTLLNAGLFIFYAANANSAAYAFLTQGAANLIRSFASDELQEEYIDKMYNGDWQGTMALTEPQAGSSLSDISSSATPENGHYKIKGQKIYISSGDHDASDNIVHLLLARIDGSPAGAKGISLFVVPKHRNENGSFVNNDVTTAGLFGKMGQKGYVAAHIMLGEKDNCEGYLVGKANHGLHYMFQMMNEARISTGMLSAGNASAAYYASLQYANERPQGRHLSNKDATLPQVLIIEHADVRRMLLLQKSMVEGSIALLTYCSYLADLAQVAEGEEKENAHILFELLTPIAKSYPAEMGIVSVSNGMQVLGGAGYCDDFPLEQYYRDIRVNAIYEGTTTIHGMDLLGRKMTQHGGKGMKLLMKEIQQTIHAAKQITDLNSLAEKFETTVKSLHQVTMHLMQIAMKNSPEVFLADATLYLEYFGTVVIGWQWLRQGIVAHKASADAQGDDVSFYKSKLHTLNYFIEYELPKTIGLHERLFSNNRVTMDVKGEDIV